MTLWLCIFPIPSHHRHPPHRVQSAARAGPALILQLSLFRQEWLAAIRGAEDSVLVRFNQIVSSVDIRPPRMDILRLLSPI